MKVFLWMWAAFVGLFLLYVVLDILLMVLNEIIDAIHFPPDKRKDREVPRGS